MKVEKLGKIITQTLIGVFASVCVISFIVIIITMIEPLAFKIFFLSWVCLGTMAMIGVLFNIL